MENQTVAEEELQTTADAHSSDGNNAALEQDAKETRESSLRSLATAYFYASPRLQDEFSLEEAIQKVLDRFLDSDESLEEVEEKLLLLIAEREKAKRDDMKPSTVDRNHKILFNKLKKLFALLNEAGIDYQLAGDLSSFIEFGAESNFTHNNISISINEADIAKLAEVCKKLGLKFSDDRLISNRILKDGDPTNGIDILAQDLESDIKIGFNPFERKENGTVSEKDYYKDEAGNHMVQERVFSPELSKLVYGKRKAMLDGTPLYVQPSEYTYLQMEGSHFWKDSATMFFLAENINRDNLAKMGDMMSQRRVYNHPANTNLEDLKQMLKGVPQMDNGVSKEPPKMFVKHATNQSTESGFISNAIITTLALITFVLCFIGIAIIYLVK